MEFLNKIKSFLGIQSPPDQSLVVREPQHGDHNSLANRYEVCYYPCYPSPYHYYYYHYYPQYWGNNSDDGNSRNFDVLSDPFEMTKFFEKEMNDMLKVFGFGNFSHIFDFDSGGFDEHYSDSFHNFNESEQFSGSLRDHYLKPGFSQSKEGLKQDEVVDGKVDIKDLDKIFDKEQKKTEIVPKSFFQSFGQQVTSRTISRPDGSIEMHNTKRDSEGNEETKIVHKLGDKEYTILKKRSKDGTEIITENFLNMDQNDVKKYFPSSL